MLWQQFPIEGCPAGGGSVSDYLGVRNLWDGIVAAPCTRKVQGLHKLDDEIERPAVTFRAGWLTIENNTRHLYEGLRCREGEREGYFGYIWGRDRFTGDAQSSVTAPLRTTTGDAVSKLGKIEFALCELIIRVLSRNGVWCPFLCDIMTDMFLLSLEQPQLSMGQKRPRSEGKANLGKAQSPFRECVIVSTFSLPPVYIEKAHQGINELLNARLIEYEERFGGILLCYSEVEILESSGMVFTDEPEIQYRARFKALLFSPKPGMILEGFVRQVSAGHLMLHCFGVFHVVVPRENINSHFKFDSACDKFVNIDNESDVIEVGSKVNFSVVTLHGSSIEGSLLKASNSGTLAGVSSAVKVKKEKKEKKEKKSKKRKNTQ